MVGTKRGGRTAAVGWRGVVGGREVLAVDPLDARSAAAAVAGQDRWLRGHRYFHGVGEK